MWTRPLIKNGSWAFEDVDSPLDPLLDSLLDSLAFEVFEVHFSCSVGVLRRDSISAHIWYGMGDELI